MSGTAKLVTNLVGARLGDRYVLEEKIGSGGFAVVYRSRDTRIHKQVAIKVLDRAKVQSLRDIGRFRNEAAIAASIDDDHVIKITDYGEEGTIFYYVMELLRGHTLRSVLGMHERLHWQRACDICEQVCCALELAHERTIIHRDIKPENIFVEFRRGAENVKLLDLGIAKVLQEWDGLIGNLSTTGDFIGSPAYMAPEQSKGTKHCDFRVDLYALGIVLYELVTGSVPFRGESAWETMLLHVERPPPPLARRAPGVDFPPAFEALLLRALAKDPGKRFQNATDMREALRAVRLSQPAVAFEPLWPASGPLQQSGESIAAPADAVRSFDNLPQRPATPRAVHQLEPARARTPETARASVGGPETAPTRTLVRAPANAAAVGALPLRWRTRLLLGYLTVGSLVATCATSTLATVTLHPDVLDQFQRPVRLHPELLDDDPEPAPEPLPAPAPAPRVAVPGPPPDTGSPFDRLLLAPPEPTAPIAPEPEAAPESSAQPKPARPSTASATKSSAQTEAPQPARRPTMAMLARKAAMVIKEACLITPFSPLKDAQYTVVFQIHPITGDIEGVASAGEVPPLRQPECVKSRAKALVKSFAGASDMKREYQHSYTVVR